MSMSASILTIAIKAKIKIKNPLVAASTVNMDWLIESIAEAVVEHITTFGTVTETGSVGTIS